MLFSKSAIYTIKEKPKDATIDSHELLIRGGFISQVSSGVYTYMPLGLKVIKKVSKIIEEEMDAKGAQQILMPAVQPAELWIESGRWNEYGKELLRFKDRNDRDFVVGPTHEEVVSDIVRRYVNSYKQLPINLYQIQTKFRDEIRPRFGLMRAKEFIMKDAYSFDTDPSLLDVSYEKMRDAYNRIFKRCGMNFRIVQADSGAIGGKDSEEFMVLSNVGEDEILVCDTCDYAANVEKATSMVNEKPSKEGHIEKIHTPFAKTIGEVSKFLNVEESELAKSLFFKNEKGEVFCFVILGSDTLNLTKAKNVVSSIELSALDNRELKSLGLIAGFLGPIGLDKNIRIIADTRLKDIDSAIVGANEENYHLKNVSFKKDVNAEFFDIRSAQEGEICSQCKKGKLKKYMGIEVGHIFKLGLKYSKFMNVVCLDKEGKQQYIYMGCYGIGVGRCAQACVEQNHDADGIIWPISIAPFEVEIIQLDKTEEISELCHLLYAQLKKSKIDCLFDDRDERAGVKFKDMDLIGIPISVIVGSKNFKNNEVEIRLRKTKEKKLCKIDECFNEIMNIRNLMYKELEV
ncbi:Prolyl-tRNA synthetase bacterial type [Desulfurella amilsii]|uniref:Proline--tRNA ligase n=1 Tax=Desulfurella amilsii TaxID=1562698 RepID=A0A1X4XV32_9BACT|nr:proline--tRNA ligase [Desulfurella amilsii]OSS41391.1 Prolyl-tRNA synthetase bacterial type [Desulfurella amilsii]